MMSYAWKDDADDAYGIADHKAIVEFTTRRAKLAIPKVLRPVVEEWGGFAAKANQEKIEKKTGIANATRDVGSGPQATSSTSNAPPAQQKRRTADDVYKELENRTYVSR